MGDKLLITLDATIQLDQGGIFWMVWIPEAKGKDVTVAKGSKVEAGAKVGGDRLCKLQQSVIKGADLDHRIVWAHKVSLKGDKTVALPIPQ